MQKKKTRIKSFPVGETLNMLFFKRVGFVKILTESGKNPFGNLKF